MMKGIINKISLENFVTYASVEFRPTRNLNVIIGPNGTGKSTLLCAIVLGLGGKPKVVARGANVASYVKEGCKSAKIEIELNNPDGENYTVTRLIDLNNKTTWSINGRSKSAKDIEALKKDLHIQVDNLCQFLPQDRVQDFAKMNNQSLLENTEKSVGSEEMYEQHMMLKNLRNEQIDMEKSIDTVKNSAENEKQLNDGQVVQIQKLRQKKKLSDEIKNLKQKHAWVLFYDRTGEREKVIQYRVDALEEKTRCEELYRPLELKIKKINKTIAEFEGNMTKLRANVSRKQTALKDQHSKLDQLDENLDDLAAQLQADEATWRTHEAEVEKLTQFINRLQNDLESCIQRPDAEVHAEIAALQPQIRRCSELIQALQVRYNTATSEVEGISHAIAATEAEKRRIDNMVNNRINMLKREHPQLHTAVLWLRENQHRFRRKVYEPMLLEIDVANPRFAKYVEAAVAFRDLQAFTCEDKEDMAVLVNELRTVQQLEGINVVHSDDNVVYNPPDSIESLQRYGFKAYIRDQINAPVPILNYLCKFYKIHKVPIGNNVNTDRVPRHITNFYSDNFNYTNSTSAYTGELSTRTMEISNAHFFASSVDSGALQMLTDKLCQLHNNKQEKQQAVQQIKLHLETEEGEINRFRTLRRKLQEETERKRTIQAQINSRSRQLQAVQGRQIDLPALREKFQATCLQKVRSMMDLQNLLLEASKDFHAALAAAAVAKAEGNALKQRRVDIENSASELKVKKRKAEERVTSLERHIVQLKEEMKALKEAAQILTDGLTPRQEEFKERFKEFSSLPDDLEELQDKITDKEGRIACLGGDNNPLLAEYEARAKRIAQLTTEMESRQGDAAGKQEEMDKLQALWLPTLKLLIDRINSNFGRSFGELGCAGEVSLSTGENPYDYHQYGISIKVTYRDSEKLQQLNRHLQSGGERAVATAIYLISLQELTSSPFRCVDEINQGMDPINERHIFELLVKTTSKPNTSQYFLLTPKLLPNLHYEDTVNVVVVNNGRHCSKSDWDYSKYLAILQREK